MSLTRAARKRNFDSIENTNTLSEEQYNNLHSNGFIIIKDFIDVEDKVVKSLKKQVIRKGKPIFGVDLKRTQCNLATNSIPTRRFMTDLNSKIDALFNSDCYIRSHWVVLHSKSGSKRQQPHHDYEPSDELSNCPENKFPLAILCTLMDNTTLNVWLDGKEELARLNKGDILVFRGDFIHAGSAYENENVRMHCYLDSPLVPRIPNRTHIINELI